MDSAAAQQQFIRTADEFVQNPRSGAKIGREVSLLYRDCVNRAKAELDDMDEAQRLVDEQSVRKEGSVKRSWSRASVDDAPAEESSPAPVDL